MTNFLNSTNDLELHKAIEANRTSMAESQREIVLRVLQQQSGTKIQNGSSTKTDVIPRIRGTRKSGKYILTINDKKYETFSYKMTLRKLVETLCAENSNLIGLLSQHRTPKGRRIVARKPQEIYPGRPDLAEKYGEKLECGWWFDTNISRNQLEAYAKVICNLLDLKYDSDVLIHFP